MLEHDPKQVQNIQTRSEADKEKTFSVAMPQGKFFGYLLNPKAFSCSARLLSCFDGSGSSSSD